MNAPHIHIEAAGQPIERTHSRLVLAAIVAVFALQFHLVFVKTINWDEYWHFSLLTAHLRGETVPFLQTPFVKLFGWVPGLNGSPIRDIQMIRAMTLGFEVVTAGALYLCARRFAPAQTALLATLAYLTAGYAFLHGFALRADIIAAALLMSALALASRPGFGLARTLVIAALIGLAFVSTIKTVLYAPAFLAVAVIRWPELQRFAKAAAVVAGLSVVCLIAVALFGDVDTKRTLASLIGAGERMVSGGLFPQGRYFAKQAMLGPIFALLFIVFAFWLAKAEAAPRHKIALALLAAPLLSVVFYRNAYPYYFSFILPPVAVAITPAIDLAVRRYGAIALTAALGLSAAALWLVEPREPLENQHQLQSELRSAFPQPVVYIDESGFLGDYPRAVLQYASGWTLEAYTAAGEPTYRQRMMRDTVPLLIANSFALQNIFANQPQGDRLLAEDEAFIRANFILHGGMIYVAGKSISAGETLTAELVATPGNYRVEGAPLEIDGSIYQPGETVALDRRGYAFQNTSGEPATLRWAAAGDPIKSDITLQSLFTDY